MSTTYESRLTLAERLQLAAAVLSGAIRAVVFLAARGAHPPLTLARPWPALPIHPAAPGER